MASTSAEDGRALLGFVYQRIRETPDSDLSRALLPMAQAADGAITDYDAWGRRDEPFDRYAERSESEIVTDSAYSHHLWALKRLALIWKSHPEYLPGWDVG
ncbi:hypothetical protein AB0N28_03810 [Streptomyces sp. NPDC051130]|uniref:hypothetical protein n=1 Tax=Streptomyces sp. NPDC051130 TaxID=3157223 RepID=UPI0034149AEF